MTYPRIQVVADMLAGIDDLDAASRAVDREREIRIGMARTGEGREVVAEFLDAQAAMDDEAVLDLTDGNPTTLVDALTRYLEELEGRDELQPRARVAGELAAILAFPWPEDERRVQLHDPHYGLALHFEYPEDLETVRVQMGSNRWTVAEFPRNRETTGLVEAVAEAVYRATLARVIPDREHTVQLTRSETDQVRTWLRELDWSSGRFEAGRLTLDPQGDKMIVRTRPYSHQGIPRNDG